MKQAELNFFLSKKLLLIFSLLFLMVFPAISQEYQITGKIIDAENNMPMPGVNIIIKGTTSGTISDIEGNFKILVPIGSQLEFSFVGYVTQTVIIESQTSLTISMTTDATKLDEVVVVGYGVMKRSDLTGAVISIREEDLTAIPTTNALEVLQGKVAGLDLTRNSGQTGSGIEINIRGVRSLSEGLNDPLIIVDGIDYGTNLDINPNEIESIEVLKDASSTAIYGSRGSNGVIMITTKRGKGVPRVSFNAYYGSVKAIDYPDFFLGTDYIEFAREAHNTNGTWDDPSDDPIALVPYELFDSAHFIDWRDILIHEGLTENYQIFVSGGNEKTTYSISDFYTHEKGIFKMDEFKRYGGKLNVDHTISQWVKAGVNMAYTYTDRDKRANPLNMANKTVPVGEVYNEDGTINIYHLNDGSLISPLADEQPGVWVDNEITKRLLYGSYIELNFLNDFNFKSTFGADITDRFEGKFADEYTIQNNGGYNSASTYDYNNKFLQLENVLSFNKEFGIHRFQVILGNSVNKRKVTDNYAEGSNFPTNTFLYYNLFAAQSEILNRSSYEKDQMVSFFGRVHYNLLDRYIFQVTLREDGASTLAEGHKWAAFPSASAAWRVSQENFMKNVTFISDLKLRVSYGVSGKRSIDPYATQGLYYQSIYTWGDDELAAGYYPGTISNDLLKWETTATTDIGLDLSMLKNRFNISFDVYRQFTYNLLLPRQLPLYTGYTSVLENVGETENRGFEITTNTHNIRTSSGFNWTTDLSLFANKEEILKLSQSSRDLNNKWFTGYSSGVFYSHEKIGIWQSGDSLTALFYGFRPGDIRLKDNNNDGKITDADKVVIGQKRPKWSGGLKNSFTYKGVDLTVFIYARMGQTIDFEGYHWNSEWYEGRGAGVKVDYWTYDNPTNDFPRPDRGAKQKAFNETLRFVDGSYIKIRDITLGYSLPEKLINKVRISNFRIYTTLKNYFMLYNKIPGYDSERSGDLSFPMTKYWLFGINVDF